MLMGEESKMAYVRRRFLQMLAKSSETAGDMSRVLFGGCGTADKDCLKVLNDLEKERLVRREGWEYIRVWLPVKVFFY